MTPKGFTDDPRRDVPLKTVLSLNHPWEQDFSKREALEALALVATYSDQGYLSPTAPTIAWYDDSRLRLKIQAPTTAIDIVDQLIEQTYPSGIYDDEEIIGGQHSPPERITQLPVEPEETTAEGAYSRYSEEFEKDWEQKLTLKAARDHIEKVREEQEAKYGIERMAQLPVELQEDLDQPYSTRAKTAAQQRDEDRSRRLAGRRLYSESYGKFKKENDPVTHERGGYEENVGEYFETALGISPEVLELEEGEEDASGGRYQTDLEYCPECDAYYKPGMHIHGDEDPTELEMLNLLEEDEYTDFDEEEFY